MCSRTCKCACVVRESFRCPGAFAGRLFGTDDVRVDNFPRHLILATAFVCECVQTNARHRAPGNQMQKLRPYQTWCVVVHWRGSEGGTVLYATHYAHIRRAALTSEFITFLRHACTCSQHNIYTNLVYKSINSRPLCTGCAAQRGGHQMFAQDTTNQRASAHATM